MKDRQQRRKGRQCKCKRKGRKQNRKFRKELCPERKNGENVWKEEYDPEFDTNSVKTAKALYNEYKRIAYENNTNIISAADYVQPSETDQEHLTAQGHEILANAIFNAVVSASIV